MSVHKYIRLEDLVWNAQHPQWAAKASETRYLNLPCSSSCAAEFRTPRVRIRRYPVPDTLLSLRPPAYAPEPSGTRQPWRWRKVATVRVAAPHPRAAGFHHRPSGMPGRLENVRALPCRPGHYIWNGVALQQGRQGALNASRRLMRHTMTPAACPEYRSPSRPASPPFLRRRAPSNETRSSTSCGHRDALRPQYSAREAAFIRWRQWRGAGPFFCSVASGTRRLSAAIKQARSECGAGPHPHPTDRHARPPRPSLPRGWRSRPDRLHLRRLQHRYHVRERHHRLQRKLVYPSPLRPSLQASLLAPVANPRTSSSHAPRTVSDGASRTAPSSPSGRTRSCPPCAPTLTPPSSTPPGPSSSTTAAAARPTSTRSTAPS